MLNVHSLGCVCERCQCPEGDAVCVSMLLSVCVCLTVPGPGGSVSLRFPRWLSPNPAGAHPHCALLAIHTRLGWMWGSSAILHGAFSLLTQAWISGAGLARGIRVLSFAQPGALGAAFAPWAHTLALSYAHSRPSLGFPVQGSHTRCRTEPGLWSEAPITSHCGAGCGIPGGWGLAPCPRGVGVNGQLTRSPPITIPAVSGM